MVLDGTCQPSAEAHVLLVLQQVECEREIGQAFAHIPRPRIGKHRFSLLLQHLADRTDQAGPRKLLASATTITLPATLLASTSAVAM